jgi:putative heme-binding domain-containing protein
LPERLAVLPLLAQRKWDAAQPVLRKLLGASAAPEINKAALGLLKKFPADQTHDLVYELLPKAGPGLKRDLVALLTANAPSALELFQRMEKGEFPAAWVDVETRWRYQRGTGAVTELAKKLFGEASSDRGSVVTTYMEALKHPGDAAKGRAVFETICISCHRYGNLGVDVGPALSDARSKPPEALLADILDPNRMFEARWSAYQIDLNDGRSLVGLIHSETQDSLVVAIPGGARETVRRASVKEMKSLDRSLMPPGLEAAISKNQMADLLAFLAGK